ncbi:hypothetical protein B4166_3336 [Caldibacillus thermoamylovorans]|uniref:Uncharacterized protein n=1 Tax=Caldibacillus thermoamylovorans TaxID=35841 RepID=A0ABD4A440_9BACI|nr:hypothetical protein B4166_3336 [Caldibacillus thermoamylovorans]KIO71840.1 hypothetical protein B4167_3309 [Caldibacillus thermoamylovorans]
MANRLEGFQLCPGSFIQLAEKGRGEEIGKNTICRIRMYTIY